MSQSKEDYLLKLFPKEVKLHIFSFFTKKELSLFRSNINKDLHAACNELKEERLQKEYQKILETKQLVIKLAPEGEPYFCYFYVIDTYNKFKAFIVLDPNYLMTYQEDKLELILRVSTMMSKSGAKFSLHLMYQNKQRIQSLYESNNSCGFDEWFANLVTEIKCNALAHGKLSLFNTFFPTILNSKMLHTIIMEIVMVSYNDHPLIDSGLDEESEEGVVQSERWAKIQQYWSNLLSVHYDEYKAIVQLLIKQGIDLDSEKDQSGITATKRMKRWRQEHDYFLPEKIIEMLDLIPGLSKNENFESCLDFGSNFRIGM